MGAIYVVAGQSNANNGFDEIRAALLARDPGCTVIRVAAPGAPLTWGRSQLDWYRANELPQSLVDQVAGLMRADRTAHLAGVVWLQGEADTLDIARSDIYAERLSALFDGITAKLRAALPDRPASAFDFDVLTVLLSSYAPAAAGRDNWARIQREQLDFTAGRAGSQTINMDVLAALAGVAPGQMFRDDLHYSQRLVDALASAVAAWGTGSRSPLTSALGADIRFGSAANDLLGPATLRTTTSGSSGNLVLIGYGGDDTYRVTTSQTMVIEQVGEGRDRVLVSCNYDMSRLAPGVEEVTVSGATGRSVTGNALGNRMQGGAGRDSLYGGAGDDTICGGAGADVLDGGAGLHDRLSYGDAPVGVRVDLANAAVNTGIAAGDRYSGFEDLYGSRFADQLAGDAQNNWLWGDGGNDRVAGRAGHDRIWGGQGADTIWGDAGNDLLYGNEGNDLLYGGTGADSFVFNSALGAGNVDRIADFRPVDDSIRLEDAVFAALPQGGLSARAFGLGAVATNAAQRILYDAATGRIFYDSDGAGGAAAVLFATVTPGTALTAADFTVF
ncbi:sialate O-acetylesterase [Xinfangfangia pollutisoli]|uniref:sialate O-acetylesterase n=1 Tax=Xinfangfangia pollutisoli TaxID=2865960 RepID=UPI001CD2575C|nr:sialate O-acetylesterase [Xinfangfangia pollutisoli]